jgi:histidinol phosphatase-like enzyme
MQLGEIGAAFASPQLEHLRKLVSKVLCKQSDFEEGIFQITERMLKRGQNVCGIFFCLHGPRSVKLTAVWECEKNSIRFYGSGGEKFKIIKLDSGDDLEIVAA